MLQHHEGRGATAGSGGGAVWLLVRRAKVTWSSPVVLDGRCTPVNAAGGGIHVVHRAVS